MGEPGRRLLKNWRKAPGTDGDLRGWIKKTWARAPAELPVEDAKKEKIGPAKRKKKFPHRVLIRPLESPQKRKVVP